MTAPIDHGLTAEFLWTLYTLEEPNGILRHKERPLSMFVAGRRMSARGNCNMWNGRYANKIVGRAKGRQQTQITMPDGNKLMVQVANIIWCLRTGKWPTKEIDHKHGNVRDHSIDNIRLVSSSQNMSNRGKPKTNTSGVIGVSWSDARQKWKVHLTKNGKYVSIKPCYFDEFEDAITARKQAEREYFGEYARM